VSVKHIPSEAKTYKMRVFPVT